MSLQAFATDNERWSAVQRRLRQADGAFVYAVATTGVFCRPSCPSRHALRKNVSFFDSPARAEGAGFRACRRCRPGDPDPRGAAATRIVKACRLLEAGEITRTADLARAVDLSPFHFHREFKRHVGVTPQAYRRRVIAERAKSAIARAPSVTAAIYEGGYASSSRFYEATAGELGMRPTRVRAGAEGEQVRYVTRRCSLGAVLVAWTLAGVCNVGFGDNERKVVHALHERFPRATLAREEIPSWVDAIVDAVERPRTLQVPLDIAGTAFQERVWRELRRIPPGETRTYGQVAAAIGAKGAHRAVAAACASNSVAVVVPCHRVIREGGGLAGYRWGAKRKEALLRKERESQKEKDSP
jgi:AraC family transcriptional regulator of adaptative response/methylated-DNA-[protein]-cysteine methyltransferase